MEDGQQNGIKGRRVGKISGPSNFDTQRRQIFHARDNSVKMKPPCSLYRVYRHRARFSVLQEVLQECSRTLANHNEEKALFPLSWLRLPEERL